MFLLYNSLQRHILYIFVEASFDVSFCNDFYIFLFTDMNFLFGNGLKLISLGVKIRNIVVLDYFLSENLCRLIILIVNTMLWVSAAVCK